MVVDIFFYCVHMIALSANSDGATDDGIPLLDQPGVAG